MDVSEPASISSGIAERYAAAIFAISKEQGELAKLEQDVDDLAQALDDSEDLRDLIHSPVYARSAQQQAITAVADKMGLSASLKNTLALMASKRRLFVLPAMIVQVREKIAEEKGEMTADVTSAVALTDAQRRELTDTLKAKVGRDVKLNTTVDDALIGGLVVRVGSKMIDTSIRSKLVSLQNAMKEVG
ncbi:F0F1 ATP synthase subunit delta [Roseivivax halodurans JCM 10272]|uniref:ATP synthase subunit delta n=1 Tax=Roseivivax halodurans JCM 10272 TaxID=1449350 RepID=X7EI71_9RHOB|nr:F0F1 ATP synthase subunit delta [Roseivivax halodurans]ETX14856.1 F0F1 ATP synthase subunit delta [Roseivivax halodurans JCM 10272]